MKLHDLIEYLGSKNFRVEVIDRKLHVTGGDNELTDDIIAALTEHKSAIFAYFSEENSAADRPDPLGESGHDLSFAQRRLYFLYEYNREATHFNLPFELNLTGSICIEKIRHALEIVTERHKIYKTTYFLADGSPRQKYSLGLPTKFTYADLSGLSLEDQERQTIEKQNQLIALPFDLEVDLPLRVHLICVRKDLHSLFFVFHHIATDQWSVIQFVQEFLAIYHALVVGQAVDLADNTASYLDFVDWQNHRFRRGGYDGARSYWKDHLAGSDQILALPLDKPRPPVQSYGAGLASRPLAGALRERVKQFCRELKISEFAFYLGVYYILLSRLTGQRDIIVGVDVFGRETARFKDVAGFFVNQLPLRSQIPAGIAVEDYLRLVGEMVIRALRFQEMPFDKLVDDMGVERDPAYSPLFQVKFLYNRLSLESREFDGIEITPDGKFPIQSQYDLTFQLQDNKVVAYYNPELFFAVSVENWLSLYFLLLEEVMVTKATAVGRLLAVPLGHQLGPWINGEVKALPDELVYAAIDRSISNKPDDIAVRAGERTITYRLLGDGVGNIVTNLTRLGIRRGDKVAVYLERSIEMVMAIVAVIRVGAILVPIDVDYPSDYVDFVLDDSDSVAVISKPSLDYSLDRFYGVRLDIETLTEHAEIGARSSDYEPVGDDPAYLIYTSGSTGRAKGTIVRHKSFTNLCDWYNEFAGIGADSRVLLMIPIGFDASLKNIFSPLMRGATLVLSPPSIFDPAAVLELIEDAEVSIINTAPTALYALLRQDEPAAYRSMRSVKLFAVGGEALDLDRVRPWLQSDLCQAALANIYGPTECTDIAVAYRADKQAWLARDRVTIGRPIQNVQAFVVNDELALCPPGAIGELVIAGRGVGVGYHKLPEMTAARFLLTDLSTDEVYRTGDFCRYDVDGNLIYLGRRDGQIKIRGKRVEISEVVCQLGQLLPGRNTSVQFYTRDGVEMLLGFVEGEAASQTAIEIKQELAKRLPRHAVPSQIVFMASLPLTANGKISSEGLLDFYMTHRSSGDEPTRALTTTEALIASIWSKLLGVAVTEPETSFFSIGGDSIFSIQLVVELKKSELQVSVADVFLYPTLVELADFCDRMPRSAPHQSAKKFLEPFALIADSDRENLPPGLEDAYPVSTLQQGMLFHCRMEPDSAMYHDVFSYDVTFDYDHKCFVEAVREVINRNTSLRTGFDLDNYTIPLQLVTRLVEPLISYRDISSETEAVQDGQVAAVIEQLKQSRFNLRGPSLIRFTVLRKSLNRIQLIIDAHHTILDGWSMATLRRQIFEYYRHFRWDTPVSDIFDIGDARFVDYIAQQIDDENDAVSRDFWGRYCQSLGVGQIPPVWASRSRASIDSVDLPPTLTAKLAARVERDGVSLKVLLLMAHAYMMHTMLGAGDIFTVLTDNGRPEVAGAQNLVGLFLNVLPIKFELEGKSWRELAKSIQSDDVERKPHRRYPFANIVRDNRRVQADSMFTYTNFHVSDNLQDADWLEIESGDAFEETVFKIATVANGNIRGQIAVIIEVKLDLSKHQIDTLLREFVFGLECMAAGYDELIPVQARNRLRSFATVAGVAEAGEAGRACEFRYRGRFDAEAIDDAVSRALLESVGAGAHAGENGVPRADGAGVQAALLHGEADGWQSVSLNFGSDRFLSTRFDAFATALLDRYLAAVGPVEDLSVRVEANGKWQPIEAVERDLEYWRTQVDSAPWQLVLPFDTLRKPAAEDGSARLPLTLGRDLSTMLDQLAEEAGVDTDVVVLAGWLILLARLSGAETVLTGLAMAASGNVPIGPWGGEAIPFCLDLGDDPPVDELLSRVGIALQETRRHRVLPEDLVLGALNLQDGRRRLYPVAIELGDAQGAFGAAAASMAAGRDRLDLALCLDKTEAGLAGYLYYSDRLFDASTVERCAGYLQSLLMSMTTNRRQRITQLPMLGDSERRLLLLDWNETKVEFPRRKCIHQLFEDQAAARPDARAVVFEGQSLSYAQLNAQANRLAHHLIELGVGPDDRVAIYVERSLAMVVGLLGILKVGAAYVPLDPSFPTARLAYILEDSAPRALLTQRHLLGHLPQVAAISVTIDDYHALQPQRDDNPVIAALTAEKPAYVIFTSGSTGLPKGVTIEHGAVTNFLAAMAQAPGLGPQDVLLAVTTLAFDIAGLELYLPLSRGGTVVLASRADAADANALADLLNRHAVSVMQATPATWRLLLANGWPGKAGLKILCGGEALPTELAKSLSSRVKEIWNLYGPTETTIWSTAIRFDGAQTGPTASIGRPIANTQVYILDRHLQPVPMGVSGELHIGGVGVARGYLNRPDLTADRFIADPFSAAATARLYKTGDLARWRPDGTIDYLGRNDFQVKIRGFRIELGEIEATLAACPGVQTAVVVAREDNPGEKQLVAYLTSQPGFELSAAELRNRLAQVLTEPMIPTAFVVLPALPLTPNGKLDRRALPAPSDGSLVGIDYAAPESDVEVAVAAIWAELLTLQRISRHDHFFEIGGHSLLATQLVSRLRGCFGINLSLKELFTYPTLSSLAERIVDLQLAQFDPAELGSILGNLAQPSLGHIQ